MIIGFFNCHGRVAFDHMNYHGMEYGSPSSKNWDVDVHLHVQF